MPSLFPFAYIFSTFEIDAASTKFCICHSRVDGRASKSNYVHTHDDTDGCDQNKSNVDKEMVKRIVETTC